jgi:hypothetical protein
MANLSSLLFAISSRELIKTDLKDNCKNCTLQDQKDASLFFIPLKTMRSSSLQSLLMPIQSVNILMIIAKYKPNIGNLSIDLF